MKVLSPPPSPHVRRRIKTAAALLALSAAVVFFSFFNGYNHWEGLVNTPRALYWLGSNFVADAESWANLPYIAGKLLETVFLSIAAATTGAACALFVAILASRSMRLNAPLATAASLLASVMRNIPIAAWAMILLFSFGQNVLTGFFALFLNSFGFLARAFREVINENGDDVVEAQRAVGASWLQIVFQGIIPCTLPQMLSWTLFTVETNIRHSALVGLLTGTGIGFVFMLYYQNLNYGSAGLVVLGLIITILAIEVISNQIRRRIL
jgi:phosphonate transport system permease protein